uniref:ABC transporter ATP-binding protein n=2 Tax=Brachymonas denitrificans TaxID=28220 RepID=UPI00321FE6A7
IAMLELVDITKSFHEGQPNAYTALKNVSLTLERGKVIALHGPSGSGKTTLLTLIGCLARPTSGRVRLDGQDISSLPERFLTALRRERFGFVFQQFNLIAGMSARDNVMVPAYPTGLPFRQLLDRAEELLAQLNLSHRSGALVQTLSGGEQQRVAIARALINQPDILIADEPTANLDSALAKECLDILGELNARGTTVILSSHDPLVLDSPLVQQRVGLRDGQVQEVR